MQLSKVVSYMFWYTIAFQIGH